jgi:predicted DNA-binding protein with PD1-like motif
MKLAHKEGGYYTLNFERGESAMARLAEFLKEEGITAGHITGLGAASEVEIAYYNLDTKQYERKVVTENLEIVNLTGNVGVKEHDELVVHIHGTFGRNDFSVMGGHVFEIKVSGACEIHIVSFPGKIHRAYDGHTGLTLMCAAIE